MKPTLTSRPFLVVLLETAYLLGVLHFASSPAGAAVPPSVTVTVLVLGGALLPIVVGPRRFAGLARPATRLVGGLLVVSGGLALLSRHDAFLGDASLAGLGVVLMLLPLSLPGDGTG